MQVDPIVFVVDDDSFMRKWLQQVFRDAGMLVYAYASADELLAHADLQTRCVLLLDVTMPDMSGPELQAVLSGHGVRLPIVFLTGTSDVPMAVSAMRNGASDFLTKPVDAALLVDRVRQAFARFHMSMHPSTVDYSRRLETLTPREREVLGLMVDGLSSKEMGRTLDCSFRTIDIHRARVMAKMAAGSLAQLVRMDVERQA